MRIPALPLWVMPSMPAIYESESFTAIEMVSSVYGKMREIVADYNEFAEAVNKEVSGMAVSSSKEIEEIRKSVENRLMCKFNDLDARMGVIKSELNVYAKEYLNNIVPDTLPPVSVADNNKLLAVVNGKWTPATATDMRYDPETESLTFNIVGG